MSRPVAGQFAGPDGPAAPLRVLHVRGEMTCALYHDLTLERIVLREKISNLESRGCLPAADRVPTPEHRLVHLDAARQIDTARPVTFIDVPGNVKRSRVPRDGEGRAGASELSECQLPT
jgi:hypothetical protein